MYLVSGAVMANTCDMLNKLGGIAVSKSTSCDTSAPLIDDSVADTVIQSPPSTAPSLADAMRSVLSPGAAKKRQPGSV